MVEKNNKINLDNEEDKTREEKPKKKLKKKKSFIKKIGGWLIYLLVIVGLVYGIPKALSYWLKTNTPIAAITSSSMWPSLKKGDLILIKSVTKAEINIGDIVVYLNERGFTIHRVIELKEEVLITKGDANKVSDPPVNYSDIIGKALSYGSGKPIRFTKLGYISIWVSRNR